MTDVCKECGKPVEGKLHLDQYCDRCYVQHIGRFSNKKAREMAKKLEVEL